MKYCPKCSKTYSTDSRFCGTCGTLLEAAAPLPVPTVNDMNAWMTSHRYAAVIAAVPPEAEAQLLAIKAEAQRLFLQTTMGIVDIYLRKGGGGPPDPAKLDGLQTDYEFETPAHDAVYNEVEAKAYAIALLNFAERLFDTRGDVNRIRAAIYAAQTLPGQQDQHREKVGQLQTRLTAASPTRTVRFRESDVGIPPADSQPANVRPAPTAVPPPSSTSNYATVFLAKSPTDTQPRQTSPSSVVRDSHPTIRIPTESDLTPAQLAEKGKVEQQQQQLIVQLEGLLATRSDLAQIAAEIERARTLIDDTSIYSKRFQGIEAQYQALGDLITAEPLLEATAYEWERNWVSHWQQVRAVDEAIFRAFGNAPVVETFRTKMRAIYQRHTTIETWRESLVNLNGMALVEQLAAIDRELGGRGIADGLEQAPLAAQQAAIEALLGNDLPRILEACKRAKAYFEAEADRKATAAAQLKNEEVRKQLRELRVDLDTFYDAPNLTVDTILAKRAAVPQQIALPPDENPFDPATFAYYDLLLASQYRIQTSLSAEQQLIMTMASAEDLIKAVQKARELVAQPSDDPRQNEAYQQTLQTATKALIDKLENEANALVDTTKERLGRYEFKDALQHLNAFDQKVSAAEIVNPQQQQLAELRATAEAQATAEGKARGFMAKAAEYASDNSSTPNYPAALKELAQARNYAAWLYPEMDRLEADLRNRGEQFVDGLIKRANNLRLKGGATGFRSAEELLNQAKINIFLDRQGVEIDGVHTAIAQQKENEQRFEEFRTNIGQILEDTKKAEEIDRLPGRITAARNHIGGTRETRVIDEASWEQLDTDLKLAEERVQVWNEFREAIKIAEQSVLLSGEEAKVQEAIQLLANMSNYSFLPISEQIGRIRLNARAATVADRLRNMFNQLRSDLNERESDVSAERIDNVLRQSKGITEPDIVAEHTFFEGIFPLYDARATLTAYLTNRQFAEFEQIYTALPEGLRRNPGISRLKQAADMARQRYDFDQSLQRLLSSAQMSFDNGWDNPQAFTTIVEKIKAFAEKAPPVLRSDELRLDETALEGLAQIGSLLEQARNDVDHQRLEGARTRLETIMKNLPASAQDFGKVLIPYAEPLAYLRQVIESQVQKIQTDIFVGGTAKDQFTTLKDEFLSASKDPAHAFNSTKLAEYRGNFARVQHAECKQEAAAYIERIKQITELLEEVGRLPETFGMDTAAPSADKKQAPPSRRSGIEARLDDIRQRSMAIQATPEGQAWIGIQGDPTYDALRKNLDLADTLSGVDLWLSKTADLRSRPLPQLEEDLELAQRMLQDRVRWSGREAALKEAGIEKIIDLLKNRWARIDKHRLAIVKQIATHGKQKRSNFGLLVGFTIVAVMALVIWRVPSIHDPVFAAVFGSPTPEPTTVIVNTTPLVVTATPVPTGTPVPTATPVPPQKGVVVVPGSAKVRAHPNTNLQQVGAVTAGDEVIVTGFADAPDGARWYRLDVPTRNLGNVWLLARITIDKKVYDSIRLDSGAALNPMLQVRFEP